MVPSLVLECMALASGFLVVICYWHGGFPRLAVDCIALPFPG